MDNKKILIVEDDADFLEGMVEYLALSGFDVTGTKSALECYYSISLHQYHLVILDIGLPDQNGIVLADYIRNNTDMRIIMLTAQSSLESKIAAYQAGADIYLVKPIDFSELSASINSLLGRLDAHPHKLQEPKSLIKNKEVEPVKAQEVAQWILSRNDWTLCTPNNEAIQLTSKEFNLIERLALSPKEIVDRSELLKNLEYENDEFGNSALDALIHRLRHKKGEFSSKIPIKTAHGAGYCFSSPIIIA